MSTQNKLTYPTSDEIDPQQAIFLYEQHCAIMIVENLPPGSEFGFDMFSDRVGEKFKGIKLIPPGVHFIYASPVDKKSHQCGPRSGFFYDFKEKEMLVKRWSETEEDFDDSFEASDEEIERYRSNLRDLDRYLSAYRFSIYQDYLGLISELTPNVFQLLHPDCNRIRSVPYYVTGEVGTTSVDTPKRRFKPDSSIDEQNLLPNMQPDPKTVIHFTNLLDIQSSLKPNEVTAYNLDSTMKLELAFPDQLGRERLIQEFQFAFITFLLCHVYECFEQWKRILSLVCQADSGLNKYPEFYVKFAHTLRKQLEHVPEDLFEDIVDNKNLIRTNLDTFFQNIEALDALKSSSQLYSAAADLRAFICRKFHWQFNIEPEDEQPVVVELD